MNTQSNLIQIEEICRRCNQLRSEEILKMFAPVFNELRLKVVKIVAPKNVIIRRVDKTIVTASAH